MNGYIAFYRGKKMEVRAKTSYKAQLVAAAAFKAKKSYEVTVVLAEKEGVQVTQTVGILSLLEKERLQVTHVAVD